MISITDNLRCYYNSNMKEKTPLELERENRILQSNWNSLRKYIENEIEIIKKITGQHNLYYQIVLDKMNELEGNDKE